MTLTDTAQVRQDGVPAPPYPAAVSVAGPAWHSPLAHDGQAPLVLPETHIGQLAANDIVLTDPVASRLHAVIRWTPQGYVIQDLGSTSGTFVQGQRIAEPTVLVPGQHIRIGNTDLLFQAVQVHEGPAAAPAGAPVAAAQAAATGMPAAPVVAVPMQAIVNASTQATRSRLALWLGRQQPKWYWRVLAVGLAAYIVTTVALSTSGNTTLVPLVLLLGASLVPVTFAIFCWEEGAFADMPPVVVGSAFIAGGVLGLTAASILEGFFLSGTPGAGTALVVGIIEEGAKALAACLFLREKRLWREIDGLALGAAIGMGFAAFETAGYGLHAFLLSFGNAAPGTLVSTAVSNSTGPMTTSLVVRMLLAVFGHGTWTAIVVAAIWRERSGATFRVTQGVVVAYAISVILHTCWDTVGFTVDTFGLQIILYLVIGAVGLLVLRFFIRESLERARLGPDAPPPPPLLATLSDYLAHAFHVAGPRAVATAAAFTATPYSGTVAAQGYAPATAATLATPSVMMPAPTAPAVKPVTQAAPPAAVTPAPPAPAPVTPEPATPLVAPLSAAVLEPAISPLVVGPDGTASHGLPGELPSVSGTASTLPAPGMADATVLPSASAPAATPAAEQVAASAPPVAQAAEQTAAPADRAPDLVTCPRCGTLCPATVRFCAHCGTPLHAPQ